MGQLPLGVSTTAKGDGGMWSRVKEDPYIPKMAVITDTLGLGLFRTEGDRSLTSECSHHTWNEASHSNPQTRKEPWTEGGLADQGRETGTGNKPREPGEGRREARGHNL